MRISNLQPAADSGSGTMALMATFDVQVADDVRVCGMRLLQAPDGRMLSYAPTALGGRRSVTFSPETATAITAAASRHYSEHVTAHDRNRTSAA